MNTSTRLIIVLTVSVSAVMVLASLVSLSQRKTTLTKATQAEVMAHGLTLQTVLEENYQRGTILDVQNLINRLGNNPGIYGILLFDEKGSVVRVSDALKTQDIQDVEEARRVITSGTHAEIERQIGEEQVYSIILPLRNGRQIIGAVEIAQPISFVKASINRAQRDIIITALLLFITIFLVVLVVTRYSLANPIEELLGGAKALGRGDLNYRVIVPQNGNEISKLATEFNRMADHLSEHREAFVREAEERLALERQLRHHERLASVGRLAAGVAHEMGAPLQVIDGRAKQLLNHPDATAEVRQRNLNIIRNQTDKITNIVRQLLTLARPYNLRIREINLKDMLTGLSELLETNAIRSGVTISVTSAPGLTAPGDPELLHQVFTNICLNAIQAMPDGGRIDIECLTQRDETEERNYAVVRIQDTGPGIPEEHFSHIFDPFFTTKDVGSGTGLGLAVSNRIIEEHSGRIEAGNRSTRGAWFAVYLPMTETTRSLPPRSAPAITSIGSGASNR